MNIELTEEEFDKLCLLDIGAQLYQKLINQVSIEAQKRQISKNPYNLMDINNPSQELIIIACISAREQNWSLGMLNDFIAELIHWGYFSVEVQDKVMLAYLNTVKTEYWDSSILEKYKEVLKLNVAGWI